MPLNERRKVPGLHEDRADIIHAGALAYSEILDCGGFSHATISRHGLREGVFHERFLAGQADPIIVDLRLFSVFSLARAFEGDEVHSQHVAHLAMRIFDD
jgi:exopolyphosphatase / guanosine-5'-triphosphate,3'-diphosphate pyrophosphatase